MAKKKSPANQLIPKVSTPALDQKAPATLQDIGYPDIAEMMTLETAGILDDIIRQYVGSVSEKNTPGSGVFINQDRVLKTQIYQELAWYDLYDEVEHEPHVSAVLNTLKMIVAGKKWEIIPFKTSKAKEASARNQEVAETVKKNFEGVDNFSQDLYELNDAIGKGFSASEVIWNVDKEITIQKLMNRPQRRIQFDAVTREPKIRKISNPYYGDPVPERKMIIHRASSKYENPFGDALDQNIYWMWMFKRVVTRFWATHLEVGVAPVPIVQHPAGANSKLKDEALVIAQQIRNGAYGRIPENMSIIWAEAKNMAQAGMTYGQFLDHCDNQVTKAILGQVLTTEGSGKEGSGSKALGDIHSDVLEARVTFYSNSLACTLNSSVVKWIVDYNYANVEGYPRFQFITKKPLDRKTEAEIVKILCDAGFDVDEQYIHDTLEVPVKKKEIPKQLKPENLSGEEENLSNKEIDEDGNVITKPKQPIIKEKENV